MQKIVLTFCCIVMSGLLFGCARHSQYSESSMWHDSPQSSRASLGTQWGEGIASSVQEVNLQRISARPDDVIEIRYSSDICQGHPIVEAMVGDGRIGMSVLDEHNRKMTLIQSGQALYLQGRVGERYQLLYRNYSSSTYSVIATVDGLDVLTGKPGSFRNAGYVLDQKGVLVIEGWRKNRDEVAAFRFSSPEFAYAVNAQEGSDNYVGMIGTAVFELENPRTSASKSAYPQSFPGELPDSPYAQPPDYRH